MACALETRDPRIQVRVFGLFWILARHEQRKRAICGSRPPRIILEPRWPSLRRDRHPPRNTGRHRVSPSGANLKTPGTDNDHSEVFPIPAGCLTVAFHLRVDSVLHIQSRSIGNKLTPRHAIVRQIIWRSFLPCQLLASSLSMHFAPAPCYRAKIMNLSAYVALCKHFGPFFKVNSNLVQTRRLLSEELSTAGFLRHETPWGLLVSTGYLCGGH